MLLRSCGAGQRKFDDELNLLLIAMTGKLSPVRIRVARFFESASSKVQGSRESPSFEFVTALTGWIINYTHALNTSILDRLTLELWATCYQTLPAEGKERLTLTQRKTPLIMTDQRGLFND